MRLPATDGRRGRIGIGWSWRIELEDEEGKKEKKEARVYRAVGEDDPKEMEIN